jgi:hypothetical protein
MEFQHRSLNYDGIHAAQREGHIDYHAKTPYCKIVRERIVYNMKKGP